MNYYLNTYTIIKRKNSKAIIQNINHRDTEMNKENEINKKEIEHVFVFSQSLIPSH